MPRVAGASTFGYILHLGFGWVGGMAPFMTLTFHHHTNGYVNSTRQRKTPKKKYSTYAIQHNLKEMKNTPCPHLLHTKRIYV
mmetsp:Transcript_200/g.249  ORF Transcript_200/g.249 Transcript_200/m.249 type:complete len:82 (+) Transcript_200:37-282(+)